jgi:hypothetical protein
MPFSFLYGWLWLGALALAAPLWLHLRRKQETNIVEFSAVRFLEDQPEPRASPMRLQNLVLLLLRALALLLLVGAFAWPYLRGANTVPIKESRVYILDNTLSHQANGGFLHDRNRVVGEVLGAPNDVQTAVIELTANPQVVVALGDDRQTARQHLEALTPSFQRGSYLAAFRQANTVLANSLGDQKHIVFLGDNQENQWNENVNTPPFLRNVQVDLPKPANPLLPNLSLFEPRVQRIFLGDKSLINFTVKVGHVGPAKSAALTLRANGQTIAERAVDFDKQPETVMVQLQWETEPSAWLRGDMTVQGTPDALEGDDRVYFSLPPVIEGKVALLAQSAYLRLALSPEIMRGQWATRVLDPARLNLELAGNQDADVLCIESSYLQSAEARKLLWRYLSNGRGVFLIVNRVTPAIDGCLRELGFEAEGPVNNAPNAGEKFQFVFFNHPIFHPFLSPDFGNLMDIKVLQYVRLRANSAMPLIFSERGAGLFFQNTRFSGKLFVSALGLDREHTSWPIHQTFIPFLDLTLQTARAEDPTPTTFEPGELSMVQLPPNTAPREMVLREEGHELARVPVEQGRGQLRMPNKPGLYELTYDAGDKVEKLFSVNPSPKESQLIFVDAPEAMKAWRLNSQGDIARSMVLPARAQIRLAGVLQQRLWWWMVLGGLLALMLEMALAGRRRERA